MVYYLFVCFSGLCIRGQKGTGEEVSPSGFFLSISKLTLLSGRCLFGGNHYFRNSTVATDYLLTESSQGTYIVYFDQRDN